jgi:hypothetical protein
MQNHLVSILPPLREFLPKVMNVAISFSWLPFYSESIRCPLARVQSVVSCETYFFTIRRSLSAILICLPLLINTLIEDSKLEANCSLDSLYFYSLLCKEYFFTLYKSQLFFSFFSFFFYYSYVHTKSQLLTEINFNNQ